MAAIINGVLQSDFSDVTISDDLTVGDDATVTDDLTVGGKVILTGGDSIESTANGTITILPNGTGITQIGDAGSTSHSLAANDDLFVSGKAEFDGDSYFDNGLKTYGNINMNEGTAFTGISVNARLVPVDTAQTPDATKIEPAVTSNAVIISDWTNRLTDYGHAIETNPTLFVHSAAVTTTHWISITHDQTDGVIDCGAGTLHLGATGNVNFAGATATASTVTHDAYVELEVAGALKKFMLGS